MGDTLGLQLRLRRLDAHDAWTDEQRRTITEMAARVEDTYEQVLLRAQAAGDEWEDTISWIVGDEDKDRES